MKTAKDMTQLIGKTPLLALERLAPGKKLLAKLECFNPLSSAKDRVAYRMISDAEEQGLLSPGGVIVEPTSGNTGVGLAGVAAVRGYRVILTMPESMSVERRTLLTSLGAEVVLTPAEEGMAGAVRRAKELAEQIPGAWMADQFGNPSNPLAHYDTTGPEIWEDTGGNVEVLVACVGTGGTLTGAGRYLKERDPNVVVIAVEPAESPLLSEGRYGPHGIQGIGANFVPGVLDRSLMDEVVTVSTSMAKETARRLAREEGILAGLSSGAAAAAALEVVRRPGWEGKNAVVILPDTGERYLSAGLYRSVFSFQSGPGVLR